ncbi:hypothetical protein C8Q73DRAFT_794480 [Cubamyces lactineus]|nr:hypothetical protein C8Q73DRAFT_794480 [Cubamyces lactineus]
MASSGNSDGDAGQFLTSGSSALILSFLAIGLFLGGLLVMFAMRRYVVVNRRRAGLWDADSNGPLTWTWGDATYDSPPPFAIGLGVVRRQRDIGPRPKLYEMHAVKAPGSDWRDIMPISAQPCTSAAPRNCTANMPEPQQPHAVSDEPYATSSTGYLHPFSVGFRDFVTQIRPSRHRVRPRSPSPPPPLFMPAVSSSRDTGHMPPLPPSDIITAPADISRLRVALAILMPGQQACEASVPLYALGMADAVWSGGTLEDLQREEG